ncbi:SRPBCC family protein [Kineococcus sp. NBC_00420]|uniref:SRPBCC family protein n=1 Tax=unclassified Kineococcus TaxID=2621656 RepID=UPI002E1B9336
MATESRHLSVHVDRPVEQVYAFIADPTNIPNWAPGLGSSVVEEDGQWYVEQAEGRARVTFAPTNEFGVLDHHVVTPAGVTVYMPVRVLADGDGCEVVFTVRRVPGMSDDEFERDLGAVSADLELLRDVIQGR